MTGASSAPARDQWIARSMLPLRLVIGWIFVAAAWRRLVLAPAKHDMHAKAWMGHKINTFMPHASWPVHDVLAWLVKEPEWLNLFVRLFTAAELLVGVLVLLGLLSRLSGLATVGLGVGLMHTSGWLGPTCLSEWHTASLLVLVGTLLANNGAGAMSLDAVLERRYPDLSRFAAWHWFARPRPGSETTPLERSPAFSRTTIALATALLLYVMGTNQAFHGGVWGPLHNLSTTPGFEVGSPTLSPEGIRFSLYRDRGPETWGSHVVEVRLVDSGRAPVQRWSSDDLRQLEASQIDNVNVNEMRPGAHALVVPLGARATITLPSDPALTSIPAGAQIEVEEVGGLVFRSEAAQ